MRPHTPFHRLILASLGLILLALVDASPAFPQATAEANEYEACLTLTRREPEKAFESALAWRDAGGGFPARHCVALALVAMKKYDHAALTLEELAEDMQKAGSPLLVSVVTQTVNAWLLGEEYDRALASATAGLTLEPDNVELRIDRSRVYAQLADYQAAFNDLDHALRIDPARADALTFRGAARRHLGDMARAREDVERALLLNPALPEALNERGILRARSGEIEAARQDWLRVLELASNTPAGDEARRLLEEIDVNKNK